ncbi:hypothetical protein OH77DRAFT_296464 [Trametes cingulata]|nr:hypothetical protein OH77DRAFT_296464 [Trametes cingulata]
MRLCRIGSLAWRGESAHPGRGALALVGLTPRWSLTRARLVPPTRRKHEALTGARRRALSQPGAFGSFLRQGGSPWLAAQSGPQSSRSPPPISARTSGGLQHASGRSSRSCLMEARQRGAKPALGVCHPDVLNHPGGFNKGPIVLAKCVRPSATTAQIPMGRVWETYREEDRLSPLRSQYSNHSSQAMPTAG